MVVTVKTSAQTEMVDITAAVQEHIRKDGLRDGLLFLYVPHTTAAVTINESADPAVRSDIIMVLNQVIPWKAAYKHREGNSPAHVKATLVGASELIAVENGSLLLGTWQGIFFCEFDGPRSRKILIKTMD
jgi:secondary thiamine-phosphate synthase enzyme